tara:strand:- start:850 stop:2247 length:1398 start_codon:yes stop_codon:yes gene_type:complete
MNKKIGVFWLRDDFRLKKNLALYQATKNHDQVVTLYLFKRSKYEKQEAQKWWVSESLKEFKKKLNPLNIEIQIFKVESYETFFQNELFDKKNFSIYWNRVYEPGYLKFDDYLSLNLKKKGIEHQIFKGNILNEIYEVKKKDGTPFKVFTPFWRHAEKHFLEKIPKEEKKVNKCLKKILFFKNSIDEKKILPKKNWFTNFKDLWSPNEEHAQLKLKNFVDNEIQNYPEARNYPNILGTSKLSPFIKHGQIHVETIWQECIKSKKKGLTKYLSEIGWREFNHSLINHFPHMLKNNYSKKFDQFPWEKNSKFLIAWKKGLTGYPIVDAGMRELYSTGWMHNRVRMIVGSFLVKHLLINWREGEKYFRNCLLDYSPASNVAGWQWVAGSGADAAPYFRIFNPILQGEKFDKKGEYVKKWVPELKDLPNKFIHKPWELSDGKFKLGKDYPYPIVKHEAARAKALSAFKKI